jgi:hypothetical protein
MTRKPSAVLVTELLYPVFCKMRNHAETALENAPQIVYNMTRLDRVFFKKDAVYAG